MFLGVLYAEDFDVPDLKPEQTFGPIEPMFTLADLEAAQAVKCCEAVLAARADWEAGASNLRTQSLERIAASVMAAQNGARLLAEEVATETAKAILAVLAGLLPHLSQLHGEVEMRALLRHLLPQLGQQPRITVRIHPAALEGVRQDFRELDHDIVANVTVMTLDTLSRGDTRVGWTNGTLQRDANTIAGALTAGLRELGLIEAASCPAHTGSSDQPQRSMTHAD